jgi:hypothetical protein
MNRFRSGCSPRMALDVLTPGSGGRRMLDDLGIGELPHGRRQLDRHLQALLEPLHEAKRSDRVRRVPPRLRLE